MIRFKTTPLIPELKQECPGLFYYSFHIAVAYDGLREDDVIFPTESVNLQLRIEKTGKTLGKGYLYLVSYRSNDSESFFPPKLLEEGVEYALLKFLYI